MIRQVTGDRGEGWPATGAAKSFLRPAPRHSPGPCHFAHSLRGVQFEARDAGLESARGFIELLDGQVRLAQRFRRLARGFTQLREGLADLLSARRLGMHAFIDRLKAGCKGLDLA